MIETIINGGPLMIPLLGCSIAALAALIDRYLAFRAYSKVDTRSLRAEILTLLEENRIMEAKNLCASTPGPVSAVLLVGLQSFEKLLSIKGSPESLRLIVAKSMEDYSVTALNAVETRLNILSTVGSAAPLFGMTGTVTGMISSFGALSQAGGLDAGVVGAGIGEALITTAAGLLIALAAVIPYNMFMARAERIGLEIEEAAAEMVDFISMRAERDAQNSEK